MKSKIWLIAALLLPLQFISLPAQRWMEMMQNAPGYSLDEIRAEVDRYYKNHPKDKRYKQFKRWEYEMAPRLDAQGKVVNVQGKTWTNFRSYLSEHSFETAKANANGGGNWTFFGASNYEFGPVANTGGVGRINVVAFHPTNSSIIYVGAPSGGLWKSIDGGSNWEPLTDGIAIWGISGIAIDPVNPSIIYILTGDGDGSRSYSSGVWKSWDGGDTWSSTGLTIDYTTSNVDGYKLLMDPSSNKTLYAVMTDGLHKTTDSGDNWQVVKTGNFRDMEFKPDDPNTLFLASENKVHRSTDGGSTWTQTYAFSASAERVALAVTPANNSVVYALGGRGGANSFEGLLRSDDAGQTWTLQSDSPEIMGASQIGGGLEQVYYDMALAVSPTNPAVVHVGGINIWRSTDAGQTWSIQTYWQKGIGNLEYTHADIHELVYKGSSLYCGSDGGVFKSTNGGVNWQDLSAGLGITEFYRLAGTPQNPNLITAGAQDNGSNLLRSPIPDLTMTQILTGDGMVAAIDPTDQNLFYNGTQNGGIWRSDNAGASWTDISAQNLGTGDWVTPYVLNPWDPDHILAAYTKVGMLWNPQNTPANWVEVSVGANIGNEKAVDVAYAPSDTMTTYVVKPSFVARNTSAPNSGTWEDISPGLPTSVKYTSIAVSDVHSESIWLTCGGWNASEKVYRSTNGGVNWSNVTGTNLPNVPINVVVFEPGSDNGVYVGTDAGVYYRDDNMTDWIDFSNGLPFVRITDLEVNAVSGQIRAATFGRSLWESTLWSVNNCIDTLKLTGPVTDELRFEANLVILSDQEVDNEGDISYSTSDLITLNPGFQVALGGEFRAEMEGCVVGTMKQAQAVSGVFVEGEEQQGDADLNERGSFQLGNYPNPFNRHTWIQMELPAADHVTLDLFDMGMQRVARIVEEEAFDAGIHTIPFDATQLRSGVYFLKMTGKEAEKVRRVVIRRN